jgi:type VI secretion system protein VasG
MPLIVAEPGVGKTNFLSGLARRIEQARPNLDVIAVKAGILTAGTLLDSERENLLGALLKEAHRDGAVLCLEHLEYAVAGSPHATAMLGDALDRGAMLAGTTLPDRQSRIESYPLARRIEVIALEEPGAGDTFLVLQAAAGAIAVHHGVAIGEELLQAVVDRSIPLAGHLPAKAIALLDSAAGRASLNRAPALTLIDIYLAASCLPEG